MELKNFFAQDSQGNAQPNATCYLYAVGTETIVTGLVSVTDAPLANPFNSDPYGLIQFKAPNGIYDLRVVSGVRDYRIRVQCNDLSDSIADAAAEADRAQQIVDNFENNNSYISYPFTYVSGTSTYDVRTISGDTSTTTSNMGLWVEGAIEFDFVINNNFTFTISSTEYPNGIQMRVLKGTRFGDVGNLFIRKSDGATGVLFQQPESESILSDANKKLVELKSVIDFGAIGDGRDNTTAFGIAARNIPAKMNMQGPKASATRPDEVLIRVPAGTYQITDWIDCNLRHPIWLLDQGAIVTDVKYLQGTVVREGVRIHGNTCSTMDPATAYSIKGNNPYPESGAEVTGLSSDQALSLVTERATVGLYTENRGTPPLFTLTTPTYTATTVTSSIVVDRKRIVKGMLIDTGHTPNKYSGAITNVSSDGLTITVTGWYLSNGVVNSATTPPNDGSSAYINPQTKVWAENTNVFIFPESSANAAAGKELGVFNYRANFIPGVSGAYTGPRTWGYDSVNLGTFQSEAGYMQRGSFHYGYFGNAITHNFHAEGVGIALYSNTSNNIQIQLAPAYDVTFQVNKNGSIESGSTTVPATLVWDMHSSGTANDYDVRFAASAGSITNGSALLTISSGGVAFTGQIRPNADNTIDNGTVTTGWRRTYTREVRPGDPTSSVVWTSGTGTPEGVIAGAIGSIYTRTNGSSGSTLYVKEAGAGNTGWVPMQAVRSGNTASRPTPVAGLQYFDTTINKPIWYSGSAWVDATGTTV